uniref:Uncharacterized protein n=1 Tax=Coccidioides posadasii RMSCC 3488 TaxID=454284 RepID=A0A0J6IHR7_COCPO|nr:hypothetical protein CPAG_07689 [Coccidioides posadasii RMSCC 3488]
MNEQNTPVRESECVTDVTSCRERRPSQIPKRPPIHALASNPGHSRLPGGPGGTQHCCMHGILRKQNQPISSTLTHSLAPKDLTGQTRGKDPASDQEKIRAEKPESH